MKKLLIAALIAGSFAGVAAPAGAQIIVDRAPPPPRAEHMPPPRHGYVWAPGYWNWNHGRHVWVAGHWERERRGYSYRAPNWVQRDGHWVMERGGWGHGDRDGDGIPNRVDNHPNNPNRG
ncbi:YXWGXW repeat-containing protein [Massilia sp. 9096]|uniref:YXWGXW repeat-containing protein n=1 Tax=Massilia sp. 9096 TaxID=1500894 RepID=UPI00056239A2|nr:YXWGXW repeat-containing protein [Massilia sp. 9096]